MGKVHLDTDSLYFNHEKTKLSTYKHKRLFILQQLHERVCNVYDILIKWTIILKK